MGIDTYFEILLLFGIFLTIANFLIKSSFLSFIGLEKCNMTNMIIEAIDKSMQAK